MSDITIDVDILMFGCSRGSDYSEPCFLLMVEIADPDSDRQVVVDKNGLIVQEYNRKLKNSELGQWWLRLVLSGRIHEVVRRSLPRATKQKLLASHFSKKDLSRYVIPAASSENRLLVTHDPDYSAPVRQVLKRDLSIAVHSAVTVHPEICGGEPSACLTRLQGLVMPPQPVAGT